MGYKPPAIRDHGLAVWVDNRAPRHPMRWGYKEWLYLYKQGLNLTDLAKAMNLKTIEAMKEWIMVYKEEQGIKI